MTDTNNKRGIEVIVLEEKEDEKKGEAAEKKVKWIPPRIDPEVDSFYENLHGLIKECEYGPVDTGPLRMLKDFLKTTPNADRLTDFASDIGGELDELKDEVAEIHRSIDEVNRKIERLVEKAMADINDDYDENQVVEEDESHHSPDEPTQEPPE